MLQVIGAWVVNEKAGTIFDGVDQGGADFGHHCRTALASAKVAEFLNVFFTHIVCSMNNDGALVGIAVEALFHSHQFERISIGAFVSVASNKEAQAAFFRLGFIGELLCPFGTRVSSMSNKCVEKKCALVEINNVQSFKSAGFAEIGYGKYVGLQFVEGKEFFHSFQSQVENTATEPQAFETQRIIQFPFGKEEGSIVFYWVFGTEIGELDTWV